MNMIREGFNYNIIYKTSLGATRMQEIMVLLQGLINQEVIKKYLELNAWADEEAGTVVEALNDELVRLVRILFIGGGAVPYSVFYLTSRISRNCSNILGEITVFDKDPISATLGKFFLRKFLSSKINFNYRKISGQEIDWQSELKESDLNLVFIAAHVVGKNQILAGLSRISSSSPLIVLRNPDYDLSDKNLGSCRLDPQELNAFATNWEIEELPRLPGVGHQVLIFRRK